MTKEERAREYARNIMPFGDQTNLIKGYIQGATEQHKIDIEKACEQFCHCMGCGMYDKCYSEGDFCDAFSNFKKAMEE